MNIDDLKKLMNNAFFGNALGLPNTKKQKEFYEELIGSTVNISTTINDKPLSSNIELTPEDIGAQDKLVSNENIKTINNTSLLGSGNIKIGDDKLVAFTLNLILERIYVLENIIINGLFDKIQIENADIQNLKVKGVELFLTGEGAPSMIPDFVGQIYIKTNTTKAVYIAAGIDSVSDWINV